MTNIFLFNRDITKTNESLFTSILGKKKFAIVKFLKKPVFIKIVEG